MKSKISLHTAQDFFFQRQLFSTEQSIKMQTKLKCLAGIK